MAWSEQTLQRKTEEWKSISEEFGHMTSDEIAVEYSRLYLLVAEQEGILSPIKKRLEVAKAILAEKFVEDEKKSVKFANGSSVSIRFTTPFTVEDKPAFITWLKSNGLEAELTVSAARCSSIAKNVFEETQQVPDGLVAGDPVPVVTFRK